MVYTEIRNELFEGLRAGNLEVRLAREAADVDAAQALRYRVFYEEMTAMPTAEMAARRRDFDEFDEICDHLLVIHHDPRRGGTAVVGTYRLLLRSVAESHGRFYTAGEYDVSRILALDGELLELGRSCVDVAYRNRPTMQLLLRGIGLYVFYYDVVLMFGCASLAGVDPDALALPLSYLYHRHLAPSALRPRALAERYQAMDLLSSESIDERAALATLPPLIKGYLRAGGYVGDGAVVDEQFHTTDVCVVVKVDEVSRKFRHRYERGTGGVALG